MEHYERTSGVLLAIRCLDEGVDIPAISHGIILASTKQQREFIQRRGRLLRKSPSNPFSHIYDVFALPNQHGSESRFVLDEVKRGFLFAKDSENSESICSDLRLILNSHGINPNEITDL